MHLAHWSIARTHDREKEASGIGWELFLNYKIAIEKYKPDYFLYENNKSMSPAIREQITKELGVEPIYINSALVSAQSRHRLYWTNIPGVVLPEDKGILLRDVLETATHEKCYTLKTNGKPLTEREMEYMVREVKDGRNHFAFEYYHDATQDKSSCITANTYKGVPYNVLTEPVCLNQMQNGKSRTVDVHGLMDPVRIGTIENEAKNQEFDSQQYRVYSTEGKSVTICGQGGGVGAKTGLYAVPMLQVEAQDGKLYPVYEVCNGFINVNGRGYPIKLADGFYIIRKLTVTECKRLQTVPDSYVFPVSDSQAYKMLGNGWTVDVISHILSFAPGLTGGHAEVLSMYDGMSCGHIALDKLGVTVDRYYATEIDKYAVQTTQTNYPDTIQLGDAFQVREEGWSLYEH